ncbi:hypothetical protein JQ615_01250 [Bradyrhizobium jicamae]|uniref:Uncharacterized protein n=1 Tax=Bradyrhizobium jicamae TaxID=280332 RepID=A0ABS5FB45_9BRAD|nr:hypothetical protein [Bradyrhizobium jicamae]MBR0794008.1 hypothetical protein [Bradyrhizobium jicamae]
MEQRFHPLSKLLSQTAANLKLVNECATLAIRLSANDAARERALMETKWFDYRFMSPLDATALFAQEYQRVYRRKWATYLATDEGPKKLAFRLGDWRSSPAEFTSCWKARQFADFFAVPYQFFCEHALELLLRIGYQKPPRPNQLYSGKIFALLNEGIERAWREHCADLQLMISALPQYHLQNFAALPAQYAHEDWVVQAILLRHMDPRYIAQACFQLRVLPEARAYFEFGPRRVERAREHVESEGIARVVASALEKSDFRPSCFGILHSFDPTADECNICAFADQCRKVADAMAEHARRNCGDVDPSLARKRQLGRERVRRHRAKMKKPATTVITRGRKVP